MHWADDGPALQEPVCRAVHQLRAVLLTSGFTVLRAALCALTRTEGNAILGLQKRPVSCQRSQKHVSQLI